MSATNRGATRNEADFYPTPAWCVRRLLEAVALPGGNWLEPAAGDGAIVRAVNSVRHDVRWTACELRPPPPGVDVLAEACGTAPVRGDFLQWHHGTMHRVAITNPPFSLAQEFIERSLGAAEIVVMLLRLNYLGGAKRCEFMRRYPPDVYVLPNRPSFTGKGTDATEYAWFVWGKNDLGSEGTVRVLPLTPPEERRAA